jgi:sigma-B regulation protein RsbU (phosphoserine phosphatase)
MSAPRKAPLILVVDDDRTTVRAIQGILHRAGFQTAAAWDVASALAWVREHQPDMALLDVGLPDGTGFDVCRMLQRDSPGLQLPVLFISAHEDVSMKVQGFEAGGVDYITKPVAGPEVLARVRTHLRLKRAYEQLAELQVERVERLASAQKDAMPSPGDLPEAKFHVAVHQVLAAGGDFYDVLPVGDRIVDYLVADASGHDLAATYWTAALKALAAEYAGPLNEPGDVVGSLNRALCRILPQGAFFTLVYARLNRQHGRLALVSAGHPPPILIPADGTAAAPVRLEGDVVGAFPDAAFGLHERGVGAGDRLVLYSDGLIETRGSREAEIARLVEACAARRAVPLDRMVPAVLEEMTAGVTPQDDLLLLVVEI